MKKSIFVKNYLILLAMIALIIMPVQAALIVNKVTDEFSLESPYPVDSVKACQCSTRTDVLEINNIGDFDTLFKVEVYSPTQDLITLSDDTFGLMPGKENKVYVYIDVPCDEPLNTFYVAKVSTNYGRSKEIHKQVVSKKCQNIKINCEVSNKEILPGDVITLKVDIQNVADFTDTFRISPQLYNDFTVISEEEITLAPDEEAETYLYVKFPLTQYGLIKYPVLISSKNGNNYVSCVPQLDIQRDYDFTIKTEDFEINACEDITKKAVITFANLAETPNKYYLHLTAPDFVTLSQNTLELGPEEEDSVSLVIQPTQKEIGEYEVILTAGTEYGDMTKEKSFKLVVKDCFDSKASVEKNDNVFADKACCGQKTYNLNVRNDGLYEEAYEIITDSPGWLSVREEDQFVRLRSGQNVNIPMTVEFPCMDIEQTAFVIVKQLRSPFQTHEIRMDLESQSQRTCHNIDLLQDKFRINYNTNSIPMLLQSTGLEGGTYELELGELESKFVYLDQETIDFEAGEIKVVHVYPRDYDSYKQGTYLNKLTLGISLLKKTCKDDCAVGEEVEISYDRQFWVVLKDKNLVVKAVDYLKNFNYSRIGWGGLVSLILAGLAGIMLVIVIYMRFKPNLKIKRIKVKCMKIIKVVNIILIFLLILSILGLILIGNPNTDRFYDSPSEEKSPLLHEWKQNMPYQIDLNQYFDDPDLDVLSYTASQPNHVQVKIDANTATLKPEYNWAGEEHIVFTANDEKGGVTDSPVMTLHVMKRKPVGPMAYWNTYSTHINIVLFIILILLMLLFFDVLEEKGYNHYNPKKRKKKR